MRRKASVLMLLVLVPVIFFAGYAEGIEGYIAPAFGRLNGDNTYEIGGVIYGPEVGAQKEHFPMSKLEFPLNINFASLEGSIGFANRFEVNAVLRKSILDTDGVLKDSDYVTIFVEVDSETGEETGNTTTGEELGLPDVYSESDVELDALIFDINFRYRLIRGLFIGIGYIYQNFDYEASEFRQWYPLSDYDSQWYPEYYTPGIYGSGTALTYEVTYHIPYMEVAVKGDIRDNIHIEGGLRYSMIVKAEDEDNHLARVPPIEAQGDCEGEAYILSLKGRYDFLKHWMAALEVSYTKIDAEGDQENYVNGEWEWTTEEKIESEQIFFNLIIGFAF